MRIMNKKELSKYYRLTIEIKNIEERIQMVKSQFISSPKLTGMPGGNNISNPVEKNVQLLIRLRNKLEKRKSKAIKELNKIEEYLSSIQDIDTRLIFTKRYVELKQWNRIAKEMYMSERTVYRKHSNYLKGGQNENNR